MTFVKLKNLTKGLLVGDNTLPTDKDVLLALLEDAYDQLITRCESLHLMTMKEEGTIYRMATGTHFMRVPELPIDDNDTLDIDNELGFIVARLIAAAISRDKGGIHMNTATRRINDYNQKVYAMLEEIQYDAETDTCQFGKDVYVESCGTTA